MIEPGQSTDRPGVPGPAAPETSSGLGADWPAQAADAVDSIVAAVNDRAIRPLIIGARAVVFGMLIGVLSLIVAVTAGIALLRIFDVYVFSGRVWASYLLLGALFSGAGLFAWSRRTPSGSGSR